MEPNTQDYVFNDWNEAATHAPDLFRRGAIDLDEYQRIMSLGKAKQGQSNAQPVVAGQSQPNAPAQSFGPGQERLDPMNGRALPVQSMPSWDQVQRFLREIMGPRPAY